MVIPNSLLSGTKKKEAIDPFLDINTEHFLNAVRTGNPGCERAFSRLFKRMHSPLTTYVRRYFSDSKIIEDILQEIYIAVHGGLAAFEGRSKLSTWIFTLAYHKICNRLSEKYRGMDCNSEPAHLLENMESNDPLPDTALMQAEIVSMVEFAASKLTPHYRDAHYFRDCLGLTGKETAHVLGIAESQVRLRLHRARGLLVEIIKNHYPQEIRDIIFR